MITLKLLLHKINLLHIFSAPAILNETSPLPVTLRLGYISKAASVDQSSITQNLLPTNLIISSCFNDHPYLTACYSSIHPRQWNLSHVSWLPGASDESFIKATVSCVAHLFSQPFCVLRALPNCSRMDGLSGTSRGNRNIPIHHWGPLICTKKHKWRYTLKENTYNQKCILPACSITVPAEFLRPWLLYQDLALYSLYWLAGSLPCAVLQHLRPVSQVTARNHGNNE